MSHISGTNRESEGEIREISLPGEERDNSRRGLGANCEGQSRHQGNQHQTLRGKGKTRESPRHHGNQALSEQEVGSSYSQQQTSAAMPCSAHGEVWVTTSVREAPGSGRTAVSSTSREGGSGSGKRKAKTFMPFLLRCSCCRKESKRGKRRKRWRRRLCPESEKCGRWVHSDEFDQFNNHLQYKCCQHHEEIKPFCACPSCKRTRKAASLRGQGTPDPTDISIAEAPECTWNDENEFAGEEAEELGAGVLEAPPTGRTSSIARKPIATVFILPPISEDSATVSVSTENVGNRVVALVDNTTKRSSCSREICQ